MEEKETIVIDVQLNAKGIADQLAEVNEKIAQVKEQNAKLRKEVRDGTKTWKEVSGQLAVNEQRLKTLTTTQKVLTNQFNAQVGTNKRLGDSLKEMGAELTALKNEYRSLSASERESAKGQELLQHIQELDAAMKKADGTMGDFQRNVGNYPGSMKPVEVEIKNMTNDVSGLSSVLDGAKLAAGAFSTALGIMSLVGDEDSETAQKLAEAQKNLQSAIAITTGLQAIQNATQKESAVMMGIAKLQAWAADKAQDAYTAATGRATIAQRIFNAVAKANPYVLLAMALATVVGAMFAFTRGSKEQEKQLEETNKELLNQADIIKNLVEDYNTLNRGVTDYLQQNIDMLKSQGASLEEVRKAEDYLFEERLRQMQEEREGIKGEILSYQRWKDAYADSVESMNRLTTVRRMLLEEGAEDLAHSMDEEIEALQKLMDEQKKHLDVVDDFNARYNALWVDRNNQLADREREDEERRRKAAEEARQRTEERLRQLRQENAALAETLDSLKQIHLAEKDAEERNAKLAESIQAVIDHVGLIGEAIEALPKPQDIPLLSDAGLPADRTSPLELFAESYRENAQTIMETSSALESSFSTLSSMYQQMAQDETKTEEQRAAAARKAKAWSALQIAANSGTAMAKGIASAMDTKFPANLAAIASTMATLLSAIAQAKSLASQTFETGGVIGGYRGASMGHDNTAISARKGEMVLNANQQRQLFELANGGVTPSLTASLVSALQSMPAPVLVYSELQDFGNSVNILDNNTKLK